MHGQLKMEEFNKNSKFIKKFKHQSSQSDQFQLQYHQIKKLGLPVNKKKLRVGNWTPQENFTYLRFLEDNKNDFVTEQQRRKNKVFFRLSKILKKRTPDQCRSHHQKLQMKYQDNIQEIITNIKRKLNKKNPEILDAQAKSKSINNKKTQVTDVIQEDDQAQTIIEETNLYKIQRKGQNTVQILLFADNLKFWV